MPRYEITIGGHRYEVSSPTELTDAQAVQHAQTQVSREAGNAQAGAAENRARANSSVLSQITPSTKALSDFGTSALTGAKSALTGGLSGLLRVGDVVANPTKAPALVRDIGTSLQPAWTATKEAAAHPEEIAPAMVSGLADPHVTGNAVGQLLGLGLGGRVGDLPAGLSKVGRGAERLGVGMQKGLGGVSVPGLGILEAAMGHDPIKGAAIAASPYALEYGGRGFQKVGGALEGLKARLAATGEPPTPGLPPVGSRSSLAGPVAPWDKPTMPEAPGNPTVASYGSEQPVVESLAGEKLDVPANAEKPSLSALSDQINHSVPNTGGQAPSTTPFEPSQGPLMAEPPAIERYAPNTGGQAPSTPESLNALRTSTPSVSEAKPGMGVDWEAGEAPDITSEAGEADIPGQTILQRGMLSGDTLPSTPSPELRGFRNRLSALPEAELADVVPSDQANPVVSRSLNSLRQEIEAAKAGGDQSALDQLTRAERQAQVLRRKASGGAY